MCGSHALVLCLLYCHVEDPWRRCVVGHPRGCCGLAGMVLAHLQQRSRAAVPKIRFFITPRILYVLYGFSGVQVDHEQTFTAARGCCRCCSASENMWAEYSRDHSRFRDRNMALSTIIANDGSARGESMYEIGSPCGIFAVTRATRAQISTNLYRSDVLVIGYRAGRRTLPPRPCFFFVVVCGAPSPDITIVPRASFLGSKCG